MSLPQYLSRYSEDTTASSLVQKHYRHVLCIPAFAEENILLQNLQHLPSNHALVILVLNAPDNATETQLQRTASLATHIKETLPLIRKSAEGALLTLNPERNHNLLLLEHWQPDRRLPRKQGVGLARKLACDLACQLISEKKLTSPWIHSSDADTRFPETYFEVAKELDTHQVAAALYPFQHSSHGDARLDLCQQLYDRSLHYYVEGLRQAASPYAYHTIGSCLLLNAEHYAKVRGFPKRNAAEDFYLLNKLNKTGSILSLEQPVLDIHGRLSDRVPFGTGPAIADINQLGNPEEEYPYYHPDGFLCLKVLLEQLPLWYREQSSDFNQRVLAALPKQLKAAMQAALAELQPQQALQHACDHSQSLDGFLKHFHHWFDAFRTLRLIHLLRDNGLGTVSRNKIQP